MYIRYTNRVRTHTLLRFKHAHKWVTFIVMTGLRSVPDLKGERLFKRKCIDWNNVTQYATSRLYTHSSKYTHWIWSSSARLVLKKTTIKKNFSSDFLEGWGNMRRCVGGQEVNKTNINQPVWHIKRVQHQENHIVWGPCEAGCSVAVGPHKQPFPFSVSPLLHKCYTAPQNIRPGVDVSMLTNAKEDLRGLDWSVEAVHTGENLSGAENGELVLHG